MTKRYLTLSIAISLGLLPLQAASLTHEAALERLVAIDYGITATGKSSAAEYTLANVAEGASEWYAFNKKDGGWVILSGDDQGPCLLGYSDSGSFEYERIPEAFKWWLSQYSREIREMRTGKVAGPLDGGSRKTAEKLSETGDRKPIVPMLNTAWDQNAPFNQYTPEIDGTHAPTGCVATAMAQLMKFYDYPAKGEGVLEYSMNGSNLTLSLDTISFRWDKMLPIYGSSATEEQKEAVSRLMQACGYSVESIYEKNVTSASVYLWLKALIQNFGYAPSSRLVSRIYLNNDDWDREIYNSLAAGNPVLYSGLGSSGGHAFVCDGYSGDGYYHFNWGWAGLSNGYFLLSALNPTALGTGGGAGGFNMGQIAVVDCRPDFEGSEMKLQMGVLEGTEITYSNVSRNLSITNGGLMNLSAVAFSARPGFEIESSAGEKIYAGETNSTLEFPVAFTLTTYARKSTATLADGVYKVRPAFGIEKDGKTEWYRANVPVSSSPYWTLVISGGKGTMESNAPNSEMEVTEFGPVTGVYASTQFKVGASIENKGDRELMTNVYVLVYKKDGNLAMKSTPNPIDMMAGEKDRFDFTVVPTNISAGEYMLGLGVAVSADGKDIKEITPRIPLEVKPFQAEVEMKASEFYVKNSENVDAENVTLCFTMSCLKGNYAYPVRLWIRPSSVTEGSWGQMLQTNYIYMNQGDTGEFEYQFEYPKGEAGETYTLTANYVIPQSQAWLGTCEFTLGTPSAIETISEKDDEVVRYYTLQGIEVKNPSKGMFIRVKGGIIDKVIL